MIWSASALAGGANYGMIGHMEQLMVAIALAMLGAVMGSFAGAQVWRLRARQLVYDKTHGQPVDAAEYRRLKPLAHGRVWGDRSRDLDTGRVLPWYDLIPIVSWLWLRGRSRYTGRFIGWMELLIEVGVTAFFGLSYWLWPGDLTTLPELIKLVAWLAAGVGLAIVFVYDLKWSLVPSLPIYAAGVCGVVFATITALQIPDTAQAALSLATGVIILAGLYYILHVVSRGRWIGFGDIEIGVVLALLLGQWQLAFIALFAANAIGSAIVLPGIISGRLHRTSRVPFGPLMIAGFLVAVVIGQPLAEAMGAPLL